MIVEVKRLTWCSRCKIRTYSETLELLSYVNKRWDSTFHRICSEIRSTVCGGVPPSPCHVATLNVHVGLFCLSPQLYLPAGPWAEVHNERGQRRTQTAAKLQHEPKSAVLILSGKTCVVTQAGAWCEHKVLYEIKRPSWRFVLQNWAERFRPPLWNKTLHRVLRRRRQGINIHSSIPSWGTMRHLQPVLHLSHIVFTTEKVWWPRRMMRLNTTK